MRKLFLSVCVLLSMATFARQKEWLDPEVNAINRAAMRAAYFAYPSVESAQAGIKEKASNFMSLNGMWKFNWVQNESRLIFIRSVLRISVGSISRYRVYGK